MSAFYLVQRIRRSWRADNPAGPDASPLAKLRNPFGYGTLGDYDLEYMGSAEFEWGAIPEAYERLRKAKRLVVCEWEFGGHTFDFLYRSEDGEPFEAWTHWAEGDRTRRRPPFDGKEKPYELRDRLAGREPFGGEWRTHVYWALGENVMWAFKEDGHLRRMLDSLAAKAAA